MATTTQKASATGALALFKEQLDGNAKLFRAAGADAQALVANAYAYVRKNPAILTWDRASVISVIQDTASLGLMPHGIIPGVHIVPFRCKVTRDNGREEWIDKATPVVDYRALIDLAVRGGGVRPGVYVGEVYEDDHFEIGVRDGRPYLEHRWDYAASDEERGDFVGIYVTGERPDGSQFPPAWMNRFQLEAFRERYGRKKGPRGYYYVGKWGGDEDDIRSMYRKTVVRRFVDKVPKSARKLRALATALDVDERDVRESTWTTGPSRAATKGESIAADMGIGGEIRETEAEVREPDRHAGDQGTPEDRPNPLASDEEQGAEAWGGAGAPSDDAFLAASKVEWPMGKEKGKPIDECDLSYLVWFSTKGRDRIRSPKLREALDTYLAHPTIAAEVAALGDGQAEF